MKTPEHTFLYRDKQADNEQEVTLKLYGDNTFELRNANSGYYGNVQNFFTGRYILNKNSLSLYIDTKHHHRFFLVEDEPVEETETFSETIETVVSPEQSVTFIFPNSRGEWVVTLRKKGNYFSVQDISFF